MSEIWDVIIIGGGPAGATTAIKLRQLGRKVLVLEKEKFPRFHIGESLLPYNQPIFQDLGLAEKIAASGFMIKRGAQFRMGDGTRGIRLSFAQGEFTEYPEAMHVERSVFDQMLLDHARALGAEAREEMLFLSHEVLDECVRVRFRSSDGIENIERGRFFVDATGLANKTANAANMRSYYDGHRKVAAFGHFKNVVMSEGDHRGDIIIVRRRNSWAWLIPLQDDKVSVGLVFDKSEFASGTDPDALFGDAVKASAELQRRMVAAEPLGPLHTIVDFSYTNRELVSERVMRVGDAAGFIDPIFSSGVFLAMQSGREAALVLHDALDRKDGLSSGMRAYEKQTRRRIGIYWEFISKFYTHPFTELFFQPRPGKLLSAINAVLAGRTELPWAARWRLRFFFLLVRLQGWVKIAGRVPMPEA